MSRLFTIPDRLASCVCERKHFSRGYSWYSAIKNSTRESIFIVSLQAVPYNLVISEEFHGDEVYLSHSYPAYTVFLSSGMSQTAVKSQLTILHWDDDPGGT